MIDLHPGVAVRAGELLAALLTQRSYPAVNLAGADVKHNTPETATRPDTPRKLSSTEFVAPCGALICGDVIDADTSPQVLPSASTRVNADIHTPCTSS